MDTKKKHTIKLQMILTTCVPSKFLKCFLNVSCVLHFLHSSKSVEKDVKEPFVFRKRFSLPDHKKSWLKNSLIKVAYLKGRAFALSKHIALFEHIKEIEWETSVRM